MNASPTTTVASAPPTHARNFAYRFQAGFRKQMARLHARYIPPGERVLEWGCGGGNCWRRCNRRRVWAWSRTRNWWRRRGRSMAGACEFIQGQLPETAVEGQWDHIVLNYLPGYLRDAQTAFEALLKQSTRGRGCTSLR